MLELKISGIKRLAKFVEQEWDKRSHAMIKYTLLEVVKRIYEDIVSRIPVTEPWLEMYRNSLKIYEIVDLPKTNVGFAISSRVSGDWSMVEGDKMIVYFDAHDRSPEVLTGTILEEFSPFAVDQIPNLKFYGAKVFTRRVRHDEIEEVRQKNIEQKPKLINELKDLGVEVRPGQAKIEGTIFFDLYFAVIRMELGLGDVRSPHWRPALRNIGVYLSKMMRTRSVQKIIQGYFEPSKVKWKKDLRKTLPTVRLMHIGAFEDFQEKVRPR